MGGDVPNKYKILFFIIQIEFYFSDSNLQKDRFLKQAISKNPDGCKSIFNSRDIICLI